jgi:UDP-GlcNAc:undecaprenyl-phosphate GlcNAc-1-phosphate transferase
MIEVIAVGGLAAVVAGFVTFIMVPVVVRLAPAFKALDEPGGRKLHNGAVPRIGGVAIAFGLLFGAGAMALVMWHDWGSRVARTDLFALLAGVGLVFLVGIVDDLVGVSVVSKFVIETVAAGLLVANGWCFTIIAGPFGHEHELGALSAVISVVWIVGVTNAINLMDGLDGLASGVIAIIAGSFFVYAVMQENYFTVILMGGVLGSCLGFLRHNWEPAKIFLGDSGSLTLGYLLAVTSVHSSIKASAAVAILVPMLALGVPVIDTLLVMVLRFLERPHSRLAQRLGGVFSADRNHLHHLIEAWRGSHATVVRVIYALVGLSCGGALLVAMSKSGMAAFSIAVVELAVIVVIRRAGLAARARATMAEKRTQVRQQIQDRSGEVPALRQP